MADHDASRAEAAGAEADRAATYVEAEPARPGQASPIIPPRTVARTALLSLVAIMSFLACLSVGSVSVVVDRAQGWQRQIAEEVTIQLKPDRGDPEAAVRRAVEVALQMPGVRAAVPISEAESAALLAPWLGRDFDQSELPIPRLIAVRIGDDADLAALARRLKDEVPGAVLDDHGVWLGRLAAMANIVIAAGICILLLVCAATALSIVFATRGAMSGSRDVIAVLHFVGAEDRYIAREFQRHFLALGLKGAGIGGGAAIAAFLVIQLLAGGAGSARNESQPSGLLGGLEIGVAAYLGALAAVLGIAGIIALTARLTVRRTLRELD